MEFTEIDNTTEVSLRFEHCIPSVYVDYNIGHFVVNRNIADILDENMEVFKKLAEGVIQPREGKEFTPEEKEEILALCRERMKSILDGIEDSEGFEEEGESSDETPIATQ